MRCSVALLPVVVLVGACVQPMPQPAPAALHTTRPVSDVVQTAARELTAAGFEIATSDAAAGVLTAKRVRGPHGNADYIACNWARGSISDTHARTSLTLSLTARPAAAGGTDVQLTSQTSVSYPDLQGTAMSSPDSDDACVSNGKAEKAIAAALGA